jgi:hypothetical protein
MVLRRKPSLMEFFMETHLQIDDRQKEVQQLVDSRVQHFMVCCFQPIFKVIIFLNLLIFFPRYI